MKWILPFTQQRFKSTPVILTSVFFGYRHAIPTNFLQRKIGTEKKEQMAMYFSIPSFQQVQEEYFRS